MTSTLLLTLIHSSVILVLFLMIQHILTFGIMTFRNLVFHTLEKVGLETRLTPGAFISSA